MKITDKRAMGKDYGDLKPGACFEIHGKIYVKTNVNACYEEMYAVSLDDGRIEAIGSKVIVVPVIAELLIM